MACSQLKPDIIYDLTENILYQDIDTSIYPCSQNDSNLVVPVSPYRYLWKAPVFWSGGVQGGIRIFIIWEIKRSGIAARQKQRGIHRVFRLHHEPELERLFSADTHIIWNVVFCKACIQALDSLAFVIVD